MDQTLMARYTPFLEQVLTPSRLRHSYGVMQVMQELAEIYDLDPDKALLAGLLHDAAKELSPQRVQQIVDEAGIQIGEPCEQNYELYLHGPVSAYFIYKELAITDEIILDAIRIHTYFGPIGPTFNSPLVWCLRFADLLEPNRSWDQCIREGIPDLRKVVYAGQLIQGAFLQIDLVIKLFEEKGFPIHSNLRHIYQEFSPSNNKP